MTRSFIICTPYQVLSGWSYKGTSGVACSMDGGQVHTGFWWEDNIKVDL